MSASTFERVIVGVDGREGGRDALALAALLQRSCDAELIAVHVPSSEHALPEDVLTRLEGWLATAGVQARPVIVHEPSPAQALHSIAERDQADLIVVGAPHRKGGDRVLGGDMAASTVHGAPCAVAVAPAGYADRGPVLAMIGAGFDGSPESHAALALARRIALAAKGSLRPYTVVTPPLPMWPATSGDPGWEETKAGALEHGRAQLRAALKAIGDAGAGYALAGDPAAELARHSGHLDLLVVGSRSYGALRRLLLGSTSTQLIRDAHCPVLVLPRGCAESEDAISSAPGPQASAGTR